MQDSSEPEPAALVTSELLQSICGRARFESGDILRRKGLHYRDMYLITEGCVGVDPDIGGGAAKLIVSGAGSPIGEIGFLRGSPATATVTARTTTAALVIDDPTLRRLEHEQPALTAHLLRHLARTAEERTSYNLTWRSSTWRSLTWRSLTWRSRPSAYTASETVDVYLCRNRDMLEQAQRLRYEVYCGELRRQSPYADHDKKIIADELDDAGHVFVAVEGGETIGTLRANFAYEGSLGICEELYGMRASARHPRATGICTKFIVKRSKRGGPASARLIAAMVRYGVRNHIAECYIDCIPALLPYYRAMGFTIAGRQFFHRENGPSHPMMLDLEKHGERLSNECGLREYVKLVIKAQVIRLLDRVRRHPTTALP